MRNFRVALGAGLLLAAGAGAQPPKIVGPLLGYGCMVLNLTEQQSMDSSVHVPVRREPSDGSAVAGYAPGIVIVPTPPQTESGYTKAVAPDGGIGWIRSNMLRPYHSLGDPTAKCRAVRLSNGRAGFDTYH
jgi:hypothetical protein